MAAFRAHSTFWLNVTRALKIHMPVESVEERGVLDMELAAATVQGQSALTSSRFSGDRTSFGMIQVLADVIKTCVDQHENQDEVLDYFVLLHLYDLVQLLVSMLHHQLCLVVRKTRDPKLSQTRQRLEASDADPNLKLGAEATLVLLGIIEKTERAVRESMRQIARDVELARLNTRGGDNRMSAPVAMPTTVPLIARLVVDFERKVQTVTEGLHTSLFTAGLLLMEREEETSKLRGYVALQDGGMNADQIEDKNLERSVAHRMWCLVLDFVGGLIRLHVTDGDEGNGVWEFVSRAEALLLAAVDPKTCQRLTRAIVAEHQSLLRFVSALSGTTSRRKRWRQAFPTNAVVLMEQSRQLLRRACVLLGSSSTENNRLRKENIPKAKQGKSAGSKSVVGFGASLNLPKSPRSPRSPSAFTFAHQTLLHEHLQAVRDVEKRQLTDFHCEMENALVEVVRLASVLLTKWTSALTDRDAILVVDGVRYVDEEQLVPLLEFAPPSDTRSMTSSPGLGHLCIAMEFMLDQLALDASEAKKKTNAVLTNAIDACALLFLKTYLLHVEQYELVKRDRSELNSFFRQFNARLSGDDSAASANVDSQLIQHISKIIAG
ncbi:hypothetical protein BBO99_00008351 [Phytophthora kernoviae]|uniref:Uncharacterized protein n=2 Tax=Phytophthora kernoviae TaxID=325452 RepID=A0A3R7G8N3_9STRA|nr:hypothetical protein G195_009649 [Phytophthora kernoviae 00238/432]KAG2517225.1 hypothetical protein JM16_007478 [Phytophthora kernoviae]KAG2519081.1 hypothetical protein JM18_007445 [Phytophthora kernoviae]RLN38256.1 hypothetical protein BBI17_008151 [Phytophthora kernoviae]RLN75410.1 hypothetical protein BBO99_00008351 [Phytophthora kernoviae]